MAILHNYGPHGYIRMCLYHFLGVVLFSGLVLYSYFWLLYIFHLTLKLFFPLKSARLSNSSHARTIYIAEFLIVFLIGTCPSIIGGAISGYSISRFPPIYCDGFENQAYIFYSVTIPILTAVCISIILMILILYKVHVVSLFSYTYIFRRV